MAITTLSQARSARKETIRFVRAASQSTQGGAQYNSSFAVLPLYPGTLAGANSASGVIPIAGDAGYPPIFTPAVRWQIKSVAYSNGTGNGGGCRVTLFDRVWVAGTYAFNATAQSISPPSIPSGRRGAADGTDLELWVEQVTQSTGVMNITCQYTNNTGGTSTTPAPTPSTSQVGRCHRLPLAAGDKGITAVTQVTCSTASAGTFNLMLLRRLATLRVDFQGTLNMGQEIKTGLISIPSDAALYYLQAMDNATTGANELSIEVIDG